MLRIVKGFAPWILTDCFKEKFSISVGVPEGPLGFMRLIRVGILQAGRMQNQPVQALENASVLPEGTMPPILPVGMMPPMSLVYHAFGIRPTFDTSPATLICRPDDMLSSHLGKHILNYEPPRGFVIPAFAKFNGSAAPLYQVMILKCR